MKDQKAKIKMAECRMAKSKIKEQKSKLRNARVAGMTSLFLLFAFYILIYPCGFHNFAICLLHFDLSKG